MSRPRILTVEDESSLRHMYAAVFALRLREYCVESATDGAHALARIQQRQYDLVLTDLNMPIIDGRELYLRTRELCTRDSRRMPLFIFCSGVQAALGVVEEFCTDSLNRRLLKPFAIDALKKTLADMLAAANN